jgi:hypothetical protein
MGCVNYTYHNYTPCFFARSNYGTVNQLKIERVA